MLRPGPTEDDRWDRAVHPAGRPPRRNPLYLERARAIVAEARARGMVVLLAPAYLGYRDPHYPGYEGRPKGWHEVVLENGVEALWWLLRPNVARRFLVAGHGEANGLDRCTAAVATDGSFAVAYLPVAREIVLDR